MNKCLGCGNISDIEDVFDTNYTDYCNKCINKPVYSIKKIIKYFDIK